MWIFLTVVLIIAWRYLRKTREADLFRNGYRPQWSYIYDTRTGKTYRKIVWVKREIMIDNDKRID